MNRSDFYNDRRKERKIDFLADFRLVRQYYCRRHGLTNGEFEFLCKLHSLGTFLRGDFDQCKNTLSWNKKRWNDMLGDWIVVYRKREPSKGKNYKIYTISPKAKNMIEDCYSILCGEKGIPETPQHNPIMKEKSYNDKRYAAAIRAFNAVKNTK